MPRKTQLPPGGRGSKGVHLQYPENWDELTEEQQLEVCREMAKILAEELGQPQDIKPHELSSQLTFPQCLEAPPSGKAFIRKGHIGRAPQDRPRKSQGRL